MKTFLTRFLDRLEPVRFFKFCLVGASGIFVNEGLLWCLTEVLGMYYLFSAVFGIETSILTNFILNDLWTFRGGSRRSPLGLPKRALRYNTICVAGLMINLLVLLVLTEAFKINYLVSNLFGIAAATFWNYFMSRTWAWGWQKIE